MILAPFSLPERDPWGIKTGKHYTPFINVYESGSIGTLHRIRDPLIDRNHHYLSRGEAAYHCVLCLLDGVVDIREQYPLVPLERTVEIAKKLGVSHPIKGRSPIEVSVDFMLTIANEKQEIRYLARSYKPSKDLLKKGIVNRQALECAACIDRSVPWKLATDLEINADMAARARWLFRIYIDRPRYHVDASVADRFVDALSKQYLDQSLRIVLARSASLCSMSAPDALALFRHLVCTRRLKVDLTRPLSLKDPHLALAENFK